MSNQQAPDESAMVSGAWVEKTLGISRPTRIKLEDDGVLKPIRLSPNSHRRYNRAAVEALAAGAER